MDRIRPARRAWPLLASITAFALAATAGYTVRPGDTLSAIAARNGTSVSSLAEANGISDPNHITAGQTLQLPGSAGGGNSATGGGSGSDSIIHEVQAGEHLSGIARHYGVSAAAIATANGLGDPNLVRAGARLTIPGASTPAAGQPAPASKDEVGRLIERIAREHGWNPAFVKAIAWQESGWNNAVVSSAGAIGIMQVMPGTGAHVSRRYGRTLDLRDPTDNIRAGVLFLDELYAITNGDPRMTLAGYFQGLANVRRNGLYNATERYIDNVLALRERFG